ncbi:hypothetical protein HN51_066909, partial [Arachis hypogaea]
IDLFRWLGSPVSCLVLDLILGYYSSRCTCKLERHRLLILASAVALTMALLMIETTPDIRYAF